jgi:hypothetical protein
MMGIDPGGGCRLDWGIDNGDCLCAVFGGANTADLRPTGEYPSTGMDNPLPVAPGGGAKKALAGGCSSGAFITGIGGDRANILVVYGLASAGLISGGLKSGAFISDGF